NRGFWTLFNFLNMRKFTELNFRYLPRSDDAHLFGCWHIATNESKARRPHSGDPGRPGTTQNPIILELFPRLRPLERRFRRQTWVQVIRADLFSFRIFPKAPPLLGDVTVR